MSFIGGVDNRLKEAGASRHLSACWDERDPSAACLKRAKEDCTNKNGVWMGHVSGRGRSTGCNAPTKDAGLFCTKENQCQSTCVPISEVSVACACYGWTQSPKGQLFEFCTSKGIVGAHAD